MPATYLNELWCQAKPIVGQWAATWQRPSLEQEPRSPFCRPGHTLQKSTAPEELCCDCTCAWRIDFRLSPLPCLVHQFAVDGLRNRIALDSFFKLCLRLPFNIFLLPPTQSFSVRKRRHLQCNKICNSFPMQLHNHL